MSLRCGVVITEYSARKTAKVLKLVPFFVCFGLSSMERVLTCHQGLRPAGGRPTGGRLQEGLPCWDPLSELVSLPRTLAEPGHPSSGWGAHTLLLSTASPATTLLQGRLGAGVDTGPRCALVTGRPVSAGRLTRNHSNWKILGAGQGWIQVL